MKRKITQIIDIDELQTIIIFRATNSGKLYRPTSASKDRVGRAVVKRLLDKRYSIYSHPFLPKVYEYKLNS